jgi:Na+/H+ antiporter NhaD/arsenite permease-like protein
MAFWLLSEDPRALGHALLEYVSFVCLLGALYVTAGGVHISGDLLATPGRNCALLGLGAVLANLMGTTGASMLLVHLVLRTNSQRTHTSHLPFFFILIVSNCAGLLTPLGDPPLFLGYLRGVPFLWTLHLYPIWLVAMAYLLGLFYVVDRRAYRREPGNALARDAREQAPLRVQGLVNAVLLCGVVAAVFLPTPWRELVMVLLAGASVWLTSPEPRKANAFHFGPIIEVAILFIGIFVTMVPALHLLSAHAERLGLHAPVQFFWVAGGLSSVLDNAPTYLTFLSVAQGLGLPNEVGGTTAAHLLAISAGSVLMGANTYIGNGPNFMVKAIADSNGYKTASFLRHAGLAFLVLLPLYAATSVLLMLRA